MVDLGEWILNHDVWVVFNVYPVTELTQLDHQRWNPEVFPSGREWDYFRNGWESVLHSPQGEFANDVCVLLGYMMFYLWIIRFFDYIHPFFTRHVPFPNVDLLYICILGGIFQRGHHPMRVWKTWWRSIGKAWSRRPSSLGTGARFLGFTWNRCFWVPHNGAITLAKSQKTFGCSSKKYEITEFLDMQDHYL